MSDSVYRKTPLPVKLNLNDRNTKEQLKYGDPNDTGRGALEGVGPAPASTAKESQKDCTAVMRKDLRDWLHEHGIHGAPPSAEAEQRAMWQWIRDFHKEYNDDWFSRNMPRVLGEFKPIFVDEMKQMKAKVKAAATAPPAAKGADLLDFDQAAPAASSAPAKAPATNDLLSLESMPAASSAQAPAPAPGQGGGPGSGGGYTAASVPTPAPPQDSLLDVFAPATPSAPAAPAAAIAPAGTSGLLDLDLDAALPATAPAVVQTSTTSAPTPAVPLDPFAPAAVASTQPASVAPAVTSGKGSMDLLDLM